ncbi:MAG TPA: hypothetical protein VJS15_07220 [Allosphingosinicella sp.]|nr:hypothetical protein [Allosphingosinicella sp.]
MTIVDPLKFGLGLALLLVAVGLFWFGRGSRGFNQKKQAAAMAFVGALLCFAIGLGLIQI